MHRLRSRAIRLAFFWSLLAGGSTASATVFERLSIDELALHSSHVVRARCEAIESQWTKDRSTIYTRIDFRVAAVIRGELASERISVYLPGGIVDGESVIVIGAPSLRLGEEVLLMLTRPASGGGGLAARRGEDAFNVVGLSQGVFELRPDPKTSQTRAVSKSLDVFLTPTAEAAELPPGGTQGLLLEDLERRIREISAREEKAREAQEGEDADEIGEGAKGQQDESEVQPAPSSATQAAPGLEAQEVEGEEESGEGPPDAGAENREMGVEG